MLHKIYRVLALLWMVLVSWQLNAQEATNAGGGEATGTTGSSSFSIGQVFFNSHTGSSAELTEGVQQPYEFSVVSIAESNAPDIGLSVYPNPSEEVVYLKALEHPPAELSYRLYNSLGILLEQSGITAQRTEIEVNELSSGVYLLDVRLGGQSIRSFKIIKNSH